MATQPVAGTPHMADLPGRRGLAGLLLEAIRQAPSSEVSRAAIDRAEAGLAMARAASGVRLDLGLGVTYTSNPALAFMGELNAHELDLAGGLDDTDWTAHSQAGLHAGYLMWDGGSRQASEAAAQHGVESSHHAGRARALGVEGRVLGLYMGMRESLALEQAAMKRIKAVKKAEESAQARVDAGSGLASSVDSLRAQRAALEEGLLVIRSGREEARDALGVLVGAGPGAHLDIDLTGSPLTIDTDRNASDLVAQALGARPDLAALRAGVEAAREGLAAAERASGPTLSAVGDAWLDGGTPLLAADRGSANVGAVLNWNLADGGLRESREQSARAELRAARAALDEAVESVELAVLGSQRRLRLAEKRLESARSAEASAKAALDDLAAGFDAGTVTLERWLGAEAAAGEAEARAASAQNQIELARAELQLTLGISLLSTTSETEPQR